MSDSGAQNLADLRDPAAKWYAARFGSFFSRATNQGLGSFFFFAVLLTTSLVFGRMVWFKSKSDDAYLAQLMRTEMQPMSNVTKAAVLSVMFQALDDPEVARELYCGDESAGDCRWIETLRSETEKQIYASTPTAASSPAATAPDPSDNSQQQVSTAQCEGLDRTAQLQTRQRLAQFNLAPARCDASADHVSIRVVPEQVADTFGAEKLRDARVRRAVSDGSAFDRVISQYADELHRNEAANGPRLVAAYFISVDSVIQYWSRDTKARVEDFPTYRHWAALPYVNDLLRQMPDSHQTETHAYLDFVGKGIVYSRCQELQPDKASGVTVGAICVDFALSEVGVKRLIAAMNHSPIARAALVEFGSRGGGMTSAIEVVAGADHVNNKTMEWLKTLPASLANDAVARRDISQFNRADVLTYFISLGVKPDGRPRGVVLTIDAVGPLGSAPGMLVVTLVSLLGAIFALLVGAGSSIKIARTDQLLGQLRSLQVGVLQTDGADLITSGNDRAEELLGVPLPAFGLQQKPLSLWVVFDEEAIVSHLGHTLGLTSLQGIKRSHLGKCTREQIKEERAAGISSTYFVRLANPATYRWLIVTGGPILREGAPSIVAKWRRSSQSSSQSNGSFGVIEEVKGAIVSLLEDVLKERSDS